MVTFIRDRMIEHFGPDAEQKVKRPFAKEWDKVRDNAMASRVSGELADAPKDDFDLLGVNNFYNLFEAYYSELAPPVIGATELQQKQEKQALLGWIRTIKALRDPLSHPIEQDFRVEDSFQLLDSARRVLAKLGLESPATEVKQMFDAILSSASRDLAVDSDAVEPLDDRLPSKESIVAEFIGRDRELSELWKWFNDGIRRRWALAGEGGKGKSALAYTFAVDVKLKAPAPFQTVIWLSAKKKQFIEGQALPIEKPDFSDLDSALDRMLEHYGWLEALEQSTNDKRKIILQLLVEFPALVIIDDVDSLEGGTEDVIEFFSVDVPTTKSKVLFTSRRVIFGLGATTTHIGGLSDADSGKFIAARCELMELDPRAFPKEIIQRITQVTEGSPLYIEDLMRLIAAVGSTEEAITSWGGRGGRDARGYALQRECELLSQEARQVLIAACISPGAVSFTEIEAVTGCSSDKVTAALQELQRLFLVPKPKLIEQEQRFDVNVNTRALVRETLAQTDLYRRLAQNYQTIAKGIPVVPRRDIGGIVRQAIFFVQANKHKDAEALLLKALKKNHSNPNLLGILGVVYKAWQPPRVADARARFKRAWQLKCSRPDNYEHWFKMEARGREWTKAIEAAENGLQILPENRLLMYYVGVGRLQLGKELKQSLHAEQSQEHLRAAKRSLEAALKKSTPEITERALDTNIYRTLVLTCEALEDIDAVKRLLRLWTMKHPEDSRAVTEWQRLSARYHFSDVT